jgi:hypothetical protein
MTKFRILALCAALVSAIPAFAQQAPPSTAEVDKAKAEKQADEMVGNPKVHWTTKGPMEILMMAPFVRPRHQWELQHMFRTTEAGETRVILEALSESIKANGTAYMKYRNDWDTYWMARSRGELMERPVVVVTSGTGTQRMVGAMEVGEKLDDQDVYEFMLSQLDSTEQSTFRNVWTNATSIQREAMLDIVKGSAQYFDWRMATGSGY